MLTIGPPRPGDAVDPTLTPEEIAALFRVSPKTVRRWARTGKLPGLRASDVRKLIEPANDRTA
jgi:excisionase family DNA binding protein